MSRLKLLNLLQLEEVEMQLLPSQLGKIVYQGKQHLLHIRSVVFHFSFCFTSKHNKQQNTACDLTMSVLINCASSAFIHFSSAYETYTRSAPETTREAPACRSCTTKRHTCQTRSAESQACPWCQADPFCCSR